MLIEKTTIEVDALEELIKAVGIVHGRTYEQNLRYGLRDLLTARKAIRVATDLLPKPDR